MSEQKIETRRANGLTMTIEDPEDTAMVLAAPIATGLDALARGEIDMQIATAHKYPRALKRALTGALQMATYDEETAERCFYVVPRDGKHIDGPSVRLAEIFASSWGNLRYGSSIVDEGEKFLTARGFCHDLENNVAVAIEVVRRITNKAGKRYSDDMISTTAMAAQSIALRNAIFRVIPRAYVQKVFLEAKRVAVGDATTLVDKRAAALAWFGKASVSEAQILARLGKASLDEIGLDELAVLKGLSTAIRDGMIKVDAAFPPIAMATEPGTAPAVTKAADATAQHVAKVAKDAKEKKAKPAPALENGAPSEEEQAEIAAREAEEAKQK